MAIQLSVSVRNARLDAIETTISTAPLLRLYTGSMPADCATAATGTKILELSLPSDWLAAASSGAKAKSGTWSGAAIATGTAGYFRITDTAGTNTHIQGLVSTSGSDMNLDNTSITSGQTVTISSFTLTDANA